MKFCFELDGEAVSVDLEPQGEGRWIAKLDGRELAVTVPHQQPGYVVMTVAGTPYRAQVASARDRQYVAVGGEFYDLELVRGEPRSRDRGGRGAASGGRVCSPMPGKVTRVLVEAGAEVAAHQPLLILEAMKMENEIRAPHAGKVKRLCVEAGQMVMPADLLIEME